MNIQTAIATNYTGMFSDLSPEEKMEQIKTIKYIEFLSNTSKISLESVDLLEFSAGGGKLYTKKTKINELFHHFCKKIGEASPKTETKVDADVVKMFREDALKGAQEEAERQRRALNDQIRSHIQQIQQNENYNAQYRESIAANRQKLAAMGDPTQLLVGTSIDEMTTRLLSNKEFRFKERGNDANGYNKDCFLFETTSEIVVLYKNPIAKIDIQINFGKFKVMILPRRATILVLPLSNNIFSDPIRCGGYYHPHVASDGKVCWGDQRGLVTEYMTQMHWDKVFTYLHSILINYNPAAPYMSMENFLKLEEQQRMPCIHCKKPKNQCICPRCDWCGGKGPTCQCNWICPVCGGKGIGEENRPCKCKIPCSRCKKNKDGDCKCCEECDSQDYTVCRCEYCCDCEEHRDDCSCDH